MKIIRALVTFCVSAFTLLAQAADAPYDLVLKNA